MNARDFTRQRQRIENRFSGRRRAHAVARLVREARAVVVILGGKVVGWRLPSGEIVCTKQRYRTELDALQALERMRATNWNGHRIPTRAYPCQHCRGWHLTSQPALRAMAA